MKSLACFIVKLLDLLLPKRDIIYFHGHVGNYCGNSKYMYKYMVESYKNKKINIVPLWISKSNKDTKKIEEENGAGFIVPSQSRKDRIFLLFKLLVARYIVVTSIGDLWQYRKCLNKSNRIIIQTSNGITIKSGWFMTPLIKKPFVIQKKTQDIDFFLVSSEIERYFFSSTVLQDPRKFVITGEQRNDQFALQKKNTQLLKEELYHILEIGLEKKIAPKLILYAPSHRDAGILGKNYCTAPKFFPFKDFNSTGLIKELSENNWHIVIRSHIQAARFDTNEYDGLEELIDSGYVHFMGGDLVPDVNDYAILFDLIITDYSGVFLDFLCLDKPVLFIPYDLEKYTRERGLMFDYDLFTPGPKVLSQLDFIDEAKKLISDEMYYLDKRRYVKKIYFKYDDAHACERAVKLITPIS